MLNNNNNNNNYNNNNNNNNNNNTKTNNNNNFTNTVLLLLFNLQEQLKCMDSNLGSYDRFHADDCRNFGLNITADYFEDSKSSLD